MMDILVEGYGVVSMNRAFESKLNAASNKITLVTKNSDKFSDNVMVIANAVLLERRKYVPNAVVPLLECLNAYKQGFGHFWWRAITVSFFLRPNEVTLALLEHHADPELRAADGKCVSAYVRHGDKAIEMSLIPFTKYADAANCMWHANDASPSPKCATFHSDKKSFVSGWDAAKDEKVLYLGSEDPEVFNQAREWAAKNKVNLRYSNVSQVLLSDKQGVMTHKIMENSMPANRQMEYFSYLLHLSDLVRCRAMVCTLGSNYCRLVDEMRATVGGKANAFFADLSTETCQKPPCVHPFSVADYQGQVFDPSDKLWR